MPVPFRARDYESAIAALNSLQSNFKVLRLLRESRKLNEHSLPEMREFVLRLGIQLNDLNELNIIHVSGTKGKGSTCAFSESVLSQSGIKTGLYTSPHLMEVRERIRISGTPLSREKFADHFWSTWDRLETKKTPGLGMPSYFRFLTLMAFHVFLTEKVEAAIVEVGIGGEFDATNVISTPVVSGIASVGYDHQKVLGETIEEIARHKAGIIKVGIPVIVSPQEQHEAFDVIVKMAKERQAPIFISQPLSTYGKTEQGKSPPLGLEGSHQESNAALAMGLCQMWWRVVKEGKGSHGVGDPGVPTPVPFNTPTPEALKGLSQCRWPGRCQTLSFPERRLEFLLDGAHTIDSMEASVRWAEGRLARDCMRVLLFSCSSDRDAYALLHPLFRLHCSNPFDAVLFCPNTPKEDRNGIPADNSNLTTDAEIQKNWPDIMHQKWKVLGKGKQNKSKSVPSLEEALEWVLHRTQTPSMGCRGIQVYATGSLHLLGNLLIFLRKTLGLHSGDLS